MRLDCMTWREVEAYLETRHGVLIPTGSTEQHGPMGLIGTDTLCAAAIARGAAERVGAIVAPPLAYAPAPFNLAFPGSVSVPPELFAALAGAIVESLAGQGFRRFYVLNGHGANLAPLKAVAPPAGTAIAVRSWWEFKPVDRLRRRLYGDWEGMHATPSEVAITQARHRIVAASREALEPPEKLSPDYLRSHAGDRHGPPDAHRARFPDGRVGAHSALATPEDGETLLHTAIEAVAADFCRFCT